MTTILDSALTMPRTCVAADQVIALDSVGSTNTYAAELVRKGALFGSTSPSYPILNSLDRLTTWYPPEHFCPAT